MYIKTLAKQLLATGLLTFALLLASAGAASLEAQENTGRVKVKFPTLPSEAPAGQELSAELQEELESTIPELQGIVVLCANACEPPAEQQSSQNDVTAGALTLKAQRVAYTCKDGKCMCIGARNCVQLIAKDEKCRKRSVKCTGAGCTCNAKPKRLVR